MLLLEARPAAGESDAEIVAGAWDFAQINRRYHGIWKCSTCCPEGDLVDAGAAKALRRWAGEEREAWLAAVQSDPLLPQQLLPAEYLGRHAWEQRQAILGASGQRLRTFSR